MDPATSVYEIGITKDRTQPKIDIKDPANEYDWVETASVLKRHASKSLYVPPHLVADRPSVADRDFYYDLGPGGNLISKRLRNVIEKYAHPCFSFLPAYISGHEYFFFVSEGSIDCLDRENSNILWSPSDPCKVLHVNKYAFHADALDDPVVFRLPEFSSRIYCTEGVKREVEALGFRGIAFTKLAPAE